MFLLPEWSISLDIRWFKKYDNDIIFGSKDPVTQGMQVCKIS